MFLGNGDPSKPAAAINRISSTNNQANTGNAFFYNREEWSGVIQSLINKSTPVNIDLTARKLYLEIDGPDLWQLAGPTVQDYDSVLPNWREQMLNIMKAHKTLGIYKYSLHPSSYFIVDGQLKSINYFFCYNSTSAPISLRSVMSHISEDRQADLFPKMAALGIDVDAPTPHDQIQQLAFESFKTNFPADFMDECKQLYV